MRFYKASRAHAPAKGNVRPAENHATVHGEPCSELNTVKGYVNSRESTMECTRSIIIFSIISKSKVGTVFVK
jgi:hypothetical protein